jgi:hypothetical protein
MGTRAVRATPSGVGSGVGVKVGVGEGVCVAVGDGVDVAVGGGSVADDVAVGVMGVAVAVGVRVGDGVDVGMGLGVGVGVPSKTTLVSPPGAQSADGKLDDVGGASPSCKPANRRGRAAKNQ